MKILRAIKFVFTSRWYERTIVVPLGEHLEKACTDSPFSYALGTRSGEVFYFAGARVRGPWVYLEEIDSHSVKALKGRDQYAPSGRITFERGVQLRIADISWVADAPFGS